MSPLEISAKPLQIAASNCFSLANNHPDANGDKRIASTTAPEPEAVLIYLQLAAGTLTRKVSSNWFEDSSV